MVGRQQDLNDKGHVNISLPNMHAGMCLLFQSAEITMPTVFEFVAEEVLCIVRICCRESRLLAFFWTEVTPGSSERYVAEVTLQKMLQREPVEVVLVAKFMPIATSEPPLSRVPTGLLG